MQRVIKQKRDIWRNGVKPDRFASTSVKSAFLYIVTGKSAALA